MAREHTQQTPSPVALVTGAARRIGAAIACELHQAGYAIALHCHHSRQEADALAAQLNRTRSCSAYVFAEDLTAPGAALRLIGNVHAIMGAPALLVNNASRYFATPLGQITEADAAALIASNLTAPLLLSQAAWATGALRSIINLVDIHARSQPRSGFAPYTAAKAGLWALTEALAVEMAPKVRVNAIAVGHVVAEVRNPPSPEELADLADKAQQLQRVPLQRGGSPQDIARVVAWLASDAAAYLTGTVLPVDGGRRLGS